MTYKHILVGLDGSKKADKAFETACALASALSASLSAVWIVNRDRGMDSTFGVSEDFYQDRIGQVKQKLTPYVEKAKKQHIAITAETLLGNVKMLLAKEYPEAHGIDLIVVGDTGLNSIERLVVGSHTSYVIRNASCDVLVVK
ncbi:universal stress protein [Oenococcus sp.]|uniref:universal stress protein n=1 Tax=Oenococcus sp. TaxID=1979414 RepID=UPI0039E7FB00